MHNIILVCTHHSEFGKCNSDELYRIIESIRPDIIFEELPQELFDIFYKENLIPYEPPEVKSVKRYIKDCPINHIPVDISPSSILSSNEIDYVFEAIEKYAAYSSLVEKHKKMVFQEGYNFLNSQKNEELIEETMFLEKSLLQFHINKNRLFRIHELFYEEQHKREYEIIRNIYNYSSRETTYNQAMLLIGSGHRKTICEKINEYESKSHVKLNWTLYGN